MAFYRTGMNVGNGHWRVNRNIKEEKIKGELVMWVDTLS